MVANTDSYSPSASKPAQVVDSWTQLNLPMKIIEPRPVSRGQLFRAHSARYVEGVLSGELKNGFGNQSPSVAQSLAHTCGAMVDACWEALGNQRGAVAPCSGFHHAGHDFGGGYCTFNGLMVAALDVLGSALVHKVGILDLDMHWGNGTQDIIDRLHLHQQIAHVSRSVTASAAERWLMGLKAEIHQRFADCDLLIYQAGADSHIDDPLGGYLSTMQMEKRDVLVFEACRELGLPVAWNLAGGYQRDADKTIRPVLALHDNTFKAYAHHHLY
jgi:acetoin utilization deacetylase AcuC-like enzyme